MTPPIHPPHPPPSPSTASSSGRARGVPLLSLAPPALAIAEDISLGDEGDERSTRDIWHAITKASDLVKDGDRLENLVWRLSWGQRRLPRKPSLGSFSVATGSSTSLNTPLHEHSPHDFPPPVNPPPSPCSSMRSDRRTFGGALKLLLDDDVSFRDWVSDAKLLRNIPEISVPSVPDTPVANVEIRLVEPTPVPSRVGSLGGSLGAAGLLGAPAVPKTLSEDREGEEAAAEVSVDDEAIEEEDEYDPEGENGPMSIAKPSKSAPRSPRRKGKFFLHSSPSKGSGSESSHPSPVAPTTREIPSSANESATSPVGLVRAERRGSGSSSAGGVVMKSKKPKSRRSSQNTSTTTAAAAAKADATGDDSSTAGPGIAGPSKEKRHVSLSTMRGKFQAEKRKAAAAIATKAEESAAAVDAAEEGSGWEDEDQEGEEEWSDEHSEPIAKKAKAKSPSKHHDRRSSSRSRSGQSTSNLDLNALIQRSNRKYSTPPATSPRDPPRVPAPTPLKRMSKKERLRAAEKRAKIEAELEAQRKREMFAKKQIFGGRPGGEGLLSGMFKRGGSMVNLTEANETASPPLRPSPTHGHLPSLSKSPVGPSLLMRSKSAAAMPIETGVSVTRISPQKSKLSEEIASHDSGASSKREADESNSRRGSGSPSHSTHPPRKSSSAERRLPSDVDLESSDEGSADEDDYLATSAIHRKISELAAKKDARDARSQPTPPPQDVPQGQLPLQLDENGIVQPLSPTTRRRAIIMREMSESLRRNLIIEREKSSTSRAALKPTGRSNSFGHHPPHARPPPSTHTSILPARGSSGNLEALGHAQPTRSHTTGGHERLELHRHRSDPTLHDTGSRISPTAAHSDAPSPSPEFAPTATATGESHGRHPHFAPLPELARRRTQPTVLGGGFLRPLTRVESPPIINRTQSSANLQASRGNSPLSPSMMEAPAMQRSSTEGPMRGSTEWDAREQARRKELQARSRTGDTSYRSHGW